MQTFSYIDGNHGLVEAADRGLAYGDGLFETMLATGGRIHWLPYHLDRLDSGCSRLEIPAPPRDELQRELLERLPATGRCIVKLLLTRGSGERGYAPPAEPAPVIIICVTEAPTMTARAVGETSAEILDMRLAESEKLAGIKHLCRLEQVLAQLELRERRADEGVLLSRSGLVVGCTSANLFVVAGGRVLTPAIRAVGISGVMRRVVLESCDNLGISAAEADIDPSALTAADELFATNAVVGIRSISSLDGRRMRSTAVAERLRQAIDQRGDAS